MSQTSQSDAREGIAGREHALADMFVTMADTLVDDYDIVDLLQQLVAACVHLLGATAAGLLLVDQGGGLALVASSDEESRILELYQLQNNEGPCLDCIHTAAPVVSGDLNADAQRWPLFVPSAAEAGFRSVVALPLRLRQQVVGGLNLFYSGTQTLPAADQRLAQALADVATIGILQQRAAHKNLVLAEQLQQALNSRVTIEQAKGMIAERKGVTVDVAFSSLRRYARNHNLKLTDVAGKVIVGEIDPTAQ